MFQRALEGAPKAAPAMLNLGFVYLQMKRFADVERLMTEVIRLDSRQPQAFAMLGAARLQNGNYAGAREAFRRALALDPRNPMALEGVQLMGLTPEQLR